MSFVEGIQNLKGWMNSDNERTAQVWKALEANQVYIQHHRKSGWYYLDDIRSWESLYYSTLHSCLAHAARYLRMGRDNTLTPFKSGETPEEYFNDVMECLGLPHRQEVVPKSNQLDLKEHFPGYPRLVAHAEAAGCRLFGNQPSCRFTCDGAELVGTLQDKGFRAKALYRMAERVMQVDLRPEGVQMDARGLYQFQLPGYAKYGMGYEHLWDAVEGILRWFDTRYVDAATDSSLPKGIETVYDPSLHSWWWVAKEIGIKSVERFLTEHEAWSNAGACLAKARK